jgi:response regulator RpfG family c-di-GMP phosphodiesterase
MGGSGSKRSGGLSFQGDLAQREPAEELIPDCILVVEYEPAVRELVTSMLLSANYAARGASSGRQALALLDSGNEFEVILSDLIMPSMTGLEILRIVHPKYPDIPFVMETSIADPDAILDTFRNGAFDYLLKPFTPEQLLDVVRRALDERRARLQRRRQLERVCDVSLQLLGGATNSVEAERRSQKVTAFAIAIAKALALSKDEIKNVARAAYLRNIGKLAAQGPSSQTESRPKTGPDVVLADYCERGFQLLSKVDYLKEAAELVYSQQEWFDGTGYPRQLKGEQIPVGARIIFAADVFESLTSGRDRAPRSITEAREAIHQGSGTQFDPEVVSAFLALPEAVWIDLSREFI